MKKVEYIGANSAKSNITWYIRDAAGNTIAVCLNWDFWDHGEFGIMKKVEYATANAAKNNLTWYIRDAAGNTMAFV